METEPAPVAAANSVGPSDGLPPLRRSRAHWVRLALVFLVVGGLGFIPLMDGPRYESALVLGILLPPGIAVTSAADYARHRPEPFDGFCRSVGIGAAWFGVALLALLIHGVRSGFCDIAAGTFIVLLGPGVGCFLAGAWGAVAGEMVSVRGGWNRDRVQRLVARLLGALGPLGTIFISLIRFYESPMVFAYDPFVGYFSGTLYDTVIDYSGLYSYRVGTAFTLFAAFIGALHLARDERDRIVYQSIGRPGLLALGGASGVASILMMVMGSDLGHWQTSETISTKLGAVIEGNRCEVIYSRELPTVRAQRFARDCEAHVAQVEEWFGERGPDRITAYLFESSSQKQQLMGAGHTYIAKPWRREIYIQFRDYPHRSLGHEIAHVVAARFGRGPFDIAGDWGGWLPNPGLIEGVATAAAPKASDLSAREWSRAMVDLDILPKLDQLFALAFLAENSSIAYTVSAAFLDFVRQTHGPETVRSWYGGTPLPELTGQSWEEMEKAWHASLQEVEVTEAARRHADKRFNRPGIFGRRCPRVVDRCEGEAQQLANRGDARGAVEKLTEAIVLDPGNGELEVDRWLNRARLGERSEAKQGLEALARGEDYRPSDRDFALEMLADLELVDGSYDRAAGAYEELLRRTIDTDDARNLEIKLLASRSEAARDPVIALLIGLDGREADRVEAFELIGAWAQRMPDNGLPPYLLARYYVSEGLFPEAAARLDQSLDRRHDIERVRIEAERLRMVVACGMGDVDTAKTMFESYSAHALVAPARIEDAKRLVGRCEAH